MSWSFLTKLLEQIHHPSTYVGKIWITIFIILRIVVMAVAGESIYYDVQIKFNCNTGQPGCENVCYNAFAPLSHVRFWAFQIVMVATPPVLYLIYAVDRITCLKGRNDDDVEEDHAVKENEDSKDEGQVFSELGKRKYHKDDQNFKVQHSGWQQIYHTGLMNAYVLQLVIRFGLELGFLVLQFFLYGLTVPAIYVCSSKPFLYQVDCFISRSTEQTVFLIFTYVAILLGLLFNIWEMLH